MLGRRPPGAWRQMSPRTFQADTLWRLALCVWLPSSLTGRPACSSPCSCSGESLGSVGGPRCTASGG